MYESNLQCEAYHRMEALIRKHAPRLMAIGDREGFVQPRISIDSLDERQPGIIDRVLKLRSEGFTHKQVAEITGLRKHTCQMIWLKRKPKTKTK